MNIYITCHFIVIVLVGVGVAVDNDYEINLPEFICSHLCLLGRCIFYKTLT